MEELQCCVVSCEKPLDKVYWDNQYQSNTTGWDLGEISPPIKSYIDTLEDKAIQILIPGCGNTYEAEYLLDKGFTNVTVIDIAPTLIENLKTKFKNTSNINIVLGDFFEHQGEYDLIIEQTFFCALPPTMRQKYVWKMHQLLANKGKIAGLLFNRTFESGPPFGGSQEEYNLLFQQAFSFLKMDVCQNSATPRTGSELFIELQKNSEVLVNLYPFEGITCNGCKNTVTEKFSTLESVLNVSMSSNFAEVLIVSKDEVALKTLQKEIAYDAKYKIGKKL
ncbi:methyltransferase domain-containing protein [Flavobacterium taihuense]|uniref:Methyltransferase domain-containing protein n=1 Tax=Flavobacterium taihuense TaxID=2857508 RepID=A0ABS6Y273_9FLAO|nr:methyltransferase domain-containing protein [Flavobacterium taihuense]MBW4362626.1 methyltransferase domain-containing protein [Flavobacterium taihuense]